MRRIDLLTPRTQTDTTVEQGQPIPYADLILSRARLPTERGLTIEQIEQALQVVSAVKAAVAARADHVLLEETAWNYLRGRVSEGGWVLVDPLIPAFVRAVQNAPQVEVKAADPADPAIAAMQAQAAQHS